MASGTQHGGAPSRWTERVLFSAGLVLLAAGLFLAAFVPPTAPRGVGGIEPAERPGPGAVTPTPQVGARPAHPLARDVLARGYVLRGNYDAALDLYGRAGEDVDGLLAVARIQLARGDLDLAEAAVQRALELRDDAPAAWIELGRLVLARRRDEQEALGLFRKALDLDRDSSGAPAYTEMGRLHLRAGRLSEAQETFAGALELDETDVAARDGLARVLLARGDLDGADRELRRALAPDVNQPRALATLAEVSSRRGDVASALALVRRALELAPASVEAHTAAGRIYQATGQLFLAERHYRQAAEWSHYRAEPHLELARLHLERGANEQAMEALRAALHADPGNRSAMVGLGRDHLRAGRVEAAFRLYRRTLEIDPDYAPGHGGIGTIYLLRGRPELAVHHLRRSLELAPEQQGAQALRDKLAAAAESLAARVGEQTAVRDTGSDGE